MNYLEELKAKLIEKISIQKITLIDNSHLHKKHKSYDPKRYHIKLIIQSKQLQKLSKIESHKIIFSVLAEDMKNKIHALEIIFE
tara:strand:- start:5495 stop:5746 length:252 start_codon:yes stop_codon:yes gene_type:complete